VTTYATPPRQGALTVVVTGSFENPDELRGALADTASGVEVKTWSAGIDDAALALASPDLSAVLLGDAEAAHRPGLIGKLLDADVKALRRFTTAPIVLLVTEADSSVVDAAFAAGITDVLVLPQTADEIAFAITKAGAGRRHPPGPERGGRHGEVVTVFSPKGGTGKTVLSTNVASYLSATSGLNVLLVDLDLQFGDAAIMLGLDPERTLYELVLAPGELDAEKLAGYTTRHRCGLDVLAAPMRPEEAELVTEQKVLRLLEVARETYDVVVVDTSPFFYGPMLALLDPTDQLLLLSGPDVPTLKNVRLSLRTLEQLGFPRSRTNLVINRVTSNVGITTEDVAGALELPVRFEVPNDPTVAPAVNRGVAASLEHPESPFADAIGGIAGALAQSPAPVIPLEGGASAGSRFRCLDGQRRGPLAGRTT
jgi:pilus assembly protein CpaE